jgi:hypothetical protein
MGRCPPLFLVIIAYNANIRSEGIAPAQTPFSYSTQENTIWYVVYKRERHLEGEGKHHHQFEIDSVRYGRHSTAIFGIG